MTLAPTVRPTLQAISEVIQVFTRDVFLQGVWCQKYNTHSKSTGNPLCKGSLKYVHPPTPCPLHHCMPAAFFLLCCQLTDVPSPITLLCLNKALQHNNQIAFKHPLQIWPRIYENHCFKLLVSGIISVQKLIYTVRNPWNYIYVSLIEEIKTRWICTRFSRFQSLLDTRRQASIKNVFWKLGQKKNNQGGKKRMLPGSSMLLWTSSNIWQVSTNKIQYFDT